jgi:tRNA A37 threonylcarbamoyladenosine synthetase subunit TsaC/SUA5/YrdC
MIHTESTAIDTASNWNAHSNATSTNATDSTMTTALARMTNSTRLCGTTLQNGQLVAFPTETVYGLGGDANNRTAVQSIFTMKQRPMTDPIIVHVLHPVNAYPLWQATAFLSSSSTSPSSPPTSPSSSSYTAGSVSSSSNSSDNVEGQILQALCNTFWPGPLTIVAQACIETFVIAAAAAAAFTTNNTNSTSDTTTTATTTTTLPTTLSLLTANTGYIAVRTPMHTVARDIIRAAQSRIGIAAPSANVFGHVSPTTPQHVYDDFQSHNVLIYDEHAITNDDDDQDEEEIVKEERKGEDNRNSTTSMNANTVKNATTHRTSTGDVVPTLSCQVGVESTVVKVEQVNVMNQNMTNNSHHKNRDSTATSPQGTTKNNVMEYRVTLLRQGAISCLDIVRCLQDAGLLSRNDDENHPHESTATTRRKNTYPKIIVSSNTRRATSEHETNVAPGQTIRHYSPNVPSYLIAPQCMRHSETFRVE